MEDASALTEHFVEGMTRKISDDLIAKNKHEHLIPYLDLVLLNILKSD